MIALSCLTAARVPVEVDWALEVDYDPASTASLFQWPDQPTALVEAENDASYMAGHYLFNGTGAAG